MRSNPAKLTAILQTYFKQTSLLLIFHTSYSEEGQPKYDEMQHGTGRPAQRTQLSVFQF